MASRFLSWYSFMSLLTAAAAAWASLNAWSSCLIFSTRVCSGVSLTNDTFEARPSRLGSKETVAMFPSVTVSPAPDAMKNFLIIRSFSEPPQPAAAKTRPTRTGARSKYRR